jgi:bacterioferritin-associated ferredoxin
VIVCHCNVILKREIEGAVRSLLAADPSAPLEPQHVYRELEKRGRCCGCFPTVTAIVSQLLTNALKEVDATALGRVSPLEELLPKEG